MSSITLIVNRQRHTVDVDPTTPLLYILSDDLGLRGPKFGCGLGQCGSCTVLSGGRAIRSCITPLSAVDGAEITNLLAGLIYDEAGNRLVSNHTSKNGKRYRYYVTPERPDRSPSTSSPAKLRLSAAQIDELVYFPIRIARDIPEHPSPRGRFGQPMDGHQREQLIDRPAIGHRLEDREVAKVRIG